MRKLSAKEKHIYVTQGLQRQGSYRKDKQHPQAIDLALNMAESRLIKARLIQDTQIPQRFEINQKYVSDIQMLIKTDVELPVFKDGVKSYGVVPYDFAFLLSDSSYVIEDCQTGFTDNNETKSERVIVIPFTSAKVSAPYYQTIIASVAGINTTVTTPGFSTQYEKVFVVDYVLEAFKNLGVKVYWETYKDLYKQDCILIATTNLTLAVGLNIDGGTIVTTNIDSPVTVFKATPVGTEALNRDTKADFLTSARLSNYHKSIPISPLSIIANNQLIVFGTERFLVNRILLNYIRKPKRINLALNQGSELSPTVQEEICDVAIQILKKQIEDESYVAEVQDNKGRIE